MTELGALVLVGIIATLGYIAYLAGSKQ